VNLAGPPTVSFISNFENLVFVSLFMYSSTKKLLLLALMLEIAR